MKPSTITMIKVALRTENYGVLEMLHGFIYMRFPYFYISLAKGDHPWSRRMAPLLNFLSHLIVRNASKGETGKRTGFEDTYHGKVVPLDAARQLVSVKEDVDIRNLETIIPFRHARDIILKNPDHLVALDCPCRVGKDNPCQPLDVCLIVGEPFTSYTIEHQPGHARWITSQEAEQILQEEDERGHVHHAFFKDAVLGRFYAICNCCSCCCGAMKAQRSGVPMLISSGFICHVNTEACSACGTCEALCAFDAIHLDSTATVNETDCMGCGICVNQCPQEALTLVRDENSSEPLIIRELIASAGE